MPLALATELPGRLEAWRMAQVRARVTAVVQRRLFTEGTLVKAGQALYQLDDQSFRAALASAQAGVARAEAGLAQAQAQVERNRPLAEARAISAQEWLVTQTTLKTGQAELASARAALQAARINLDYTQITAPIAGRIGRALVSEGALVGMADAAPMAVIQQTHPLYVNFSQSAADTMRLRKAFESGQLTQNKGAQLQLLLADGSIYPQPRKVTLGGAIDSDWVVLGGLAAGERVIVDGFMTMRPGAPVTPVPWTPLGSGGAASGSAARSAPASAAAASR